MKIQLDTDAKTIKIEDNVLLSKLIETLDKLLPNKEWKKFTLETNTTIHHWTNPVIIKEYPTYPDYPWWGITYYSSNKTNADYKVTGSSNNILSADTLKSGVYNIEA